MNFTNKKFHFLFPFACTIMSLSPAYSYADSQLKVGLVDVQKAILQTEEGKAAREKIEKEIEKKRKDLLEQQQSLKKLEEEFQAQQAVLSDADKASKQKEFQAKLQKFQSSQFNFEQETRQKEMVATQQIYQNMSTIISKISKKNGYDFVFDRGAGIVLYAAKTTDLTAEVISLYNSEFPVKGGH